MCLCCSGTYADIEVEYYGDSHRYQFCNNCYEPHKTDSNGRTAKQPKPLFHPPHDLKVSYRVCTTIRVALHICTYHVSVLYQKPIEPGSLKCSCCQLWSKETSTMPNDGKIYCKNCLFSVNVKDLGVPDKVHILKQQ